MTLCSDGHLDQPGLIRAYKLVTADGIGTRDCGTTGPGTGGNAMRMKPNPVEHWYHGYKRIILTWRP